MQKNISHKDLVVWQKSITLASKVYAATSLLPREEQFGLQTQMRRAAVSIASHIAEGSARGSRLEFIQCLQISRAALAELETHYLIANAQGCLGDGQLTHAELTDIGRLLNGLIRSLVSSNQAAHAKACAPLNTHR